MAECGSLGMQLSKVMASVDIRRRLSELTAQRHKCNNFSDPGGNSTEKTAATTTTTMLLELFGPSPCANNKFGPQAYSVSPPPIRPKISGG